MDHVVNLRAGAAGGFKAEADFDAFDGLHGHDGLGDAAVELEVPLGMRSEAKGNTFDANFDNAAERVAGFAGFVDEVLHFGVARRIEGIDFTRFTNFESLGKW